MPCIDTYSKVDLRTVSFDVPPQEILSKDSVTVAVDAVVYYRSVLPRSTEISTFHLNFIIAFFSIGYLTRR